MEENMCARAPVYNLAAAVGREICETRASAKCTMLTETEGARIGRNHAGGLSPPVNIPTPASVAVTEGLIELRRVIETIEELLSRWLAVKFQLAIY